MADFFAKYPVTGGGSGNGVTIYPDLASFPVSAPEGTLAIAEDTGILYEYFGSAWVELADPSAAYLPLAGGTMTGDIDMNDQSLINAALIQSIPSQGLLLQSDEGTVEFAAKDESGGQQKYYTFYADAGAQEVVSKVFDNVATTQAGLTATLTNSKLEYTDGNDTAYINATANTLALRVETPDTSLVTSSIDVNDTSVTLAIAGPTAGSSISFSETGLVDLSASGRILIASSSIQLDEQNITDMADPVNDQDAATKKYVDDSINAIPDPITYQGTYNATTDTPALDNTDTGVEGYLYQVTVAGTQDFGAGPISFEVGDKVVNNGTVWEKWDMTDSVISVNGQNGVVVLDTDDVAEGVSNLYYTNARFDAQFGAKDTDDLPEGSTNLYYTDARVNALVTPTVDYVNRQLKQSTFIAANWDSIGFDMRDAVNGNNGRVANIGFASFAAGGSGADMIIRSNRTATIAAAGTATLATASSKAYNIMYSVLRNGGGNESRVGTLLMAKESTSTNTNASLVDTSTATNLSMNDVVFTINASGNLLVTNNTAYSIDVKIGLFQL